MRRPYPKAAVRVRIGAGASNLELIRPAGVPVRVRIGGGASKLAIDDVRVGASGGETDWRSPDRPRRELSDALEGIEVASLSGNRCGIPPGPLWTGSCSSSTSACAHDRHVVLRTTGR